MSIRSFLIVTLPLILSGCLGRRTEASVTAANNSMWAVPMYPIPATPTPIARKTKVEVSYERVP